jgi:hypothetical protein
VLFGLAVTGFEALDHRWSGHTGKLFCASSRLWIQRSGLVGSLLKCDLVATGV